MRTRRSGTSRDARPREPRPPRAARRSAARRASPGTGEDQCLDHRGDALLRDGRGDVPGDRLDRRPAPTASPPRGPPRRASRGRSTGRRSPGPRRARRPAGGPGSGSARPFETPGATNSRNIGWLIVTSARPANAARAASGDVHRPRRLADGDHLRDRVADRPEVVDELGLGAHERRVVVGVRVVRPQDEPLEVVDVRVEAVGRRPDDDVARDVGGSGRWRSSLPSRLDPGGRHLADEARPGTRRPVPSARVRGRTRRALETIRPVTSETETPTRQRRADGRPRPRSDDQVVADRASRRCRGRSGGWARRGGRADQAQARPMMTDPRGSTPSRRVTRRRAAARPGPAATEQAQPGSAPATQRPRSPSPWSAPISRNATPSVGERLRQPREQPADDVEPVRSPVERRDRLERRGDREPGDRVAADVRQVGQDHVERATTTGGSRSASTNRDVVGHRVPDRVLARQIQGVRRDIRRERPGPRRAPDAGAGATTRATAIAPLPVPTSAMRIGGVPAGRAPAVSRRMTSASAELHEHLGLRPRDERARVDDEGEAVELLDARGCRRPARRPRAARGSPR